MVRFIRTRAVWTVVFLLAAMHGQAFSAQLTASIKRKMREVTLQELSAAPGLFFNKGVKVTIPYHGKNSNVNYQISQYWLGRQNYFHLELSDTELERMCPFVIEMKRFPRLIKKVATLEMGTLVRCYGKIFDNRKKAGRRRYGFYVMDIDLADSNGKDRKPKRAFDPDEYEEVSVKRLNLMRTKYLNKKVKLDLMYQGLDSDLSYYVKNALKFTTESHCQLRSYTSSSGDNLGNIYVLINKKNEENLEVLLNAKSGCVLTTYGELRSAPYSDRLIYYISVDRINIVVKAKDLPSPARPEPVKSNGKDEKPKRAFDPDEYEEVSAKRLNLMRAKYLNKKVKLDLTYQGLDRDLSHYVKTALNFTTESHCQLRSYSSSSGDDLGNICVIINKKNEENVETLLNAKTRCVLTTYGKLKVVRSSGRPTYYISVDRINIASKAKDLPSPAHPEPVKSNGKDDKPKRAFDPDEYEEVSTKKLNLMRTKYLNKKVKLDLLYYGLMRDLSYYVKTALKFTTESHCQLRPYPGPPISGYNLGNICVIINKKNEANVETLMNAKMRCVLTTYGELKVVRSSDRPTYYISVDRINIAGKGGDLPSPARPAPAHPVPARPELDPDSYKSVTVKELMLSRSELVNKNIKLSIVYPGLALYAISPIIRHTDVTTATHLQLVQHHSKDIMIVIDRVIDDKRNVEVLSKTKKGDKVDLYGQLRKSKHPDAPEHYVDVKRIELQSSPD